MKIIKQKFGEKLKVELLNTYTFSNQDNNKFILLLRKGVYLYNYLYAWLGKIQWNIITWKKDVYSHLKFTDTDYAHAKRVSKDFEVNDLGEYHDLYVQSDTLLLADVFDNIRNMCIEIYVVDPAVF